MKTLAKNTGLLLFAVILAGCPSSKETAADTHGVSKVVIRGSNTFGEELGPRLISEYQKSHPAVQFDLESKGTGYGFGNLLVGGCDIAAASRPVNQNELSFAKDRDIEMNEYVLGSYSVAVIVNSGNSVTDLTKEQVRDIFTGAITNWQQLGGAEAPIHLFIRDPISGTYLGFQELAMENKPYALEPATSTNYLGIAQQVAKDPNGIGYVSIELAMKQPGVKGVAIGGIAPILNVVQKGDYPYARTLHFYTNKARELTPAREFVDYVLSDAGQKVLMDMGYVPHP